MQQRIPAYGVAPLRYLQLVKIERAKTLLGEGSSTVHTVAQVLGYRDVGNFTHIFRELAGETPGRWRERSRYLHPALHHRTAGDEKSGQPAAHQLSPRAVTAFRGGRGGVDQV